MSVQSDDSAAHIARLGGLGSRLALIVLVLVGECVVHTYIFQAVPYAGGGDARGLVQAGLHALFRFSVAYIVFVSILAGAHKLRRTVDVSSFAAAPISQFWVLGHFALVGAIAALSFAMHARVTAVDYWWLASLWLLCGASAVAALFLSLAPGRRWLMALHSFRFSLLGAVPPALATLFAIQLSQSLWRPAARLTFVLVDRELGLILPGIRSDAATQILGTGRFRVFITDACSGMEGLGLTLVFCVVILWLHRRELRFPRAFIILPASLILMFLLNSLRIASLVLIGNAGYPEVASVGFHSQAGWILFNLVAVLVAVAARRISWLSVEPAQGAAAGKPDSSADNPVAPYLMPLVSSLAVGMLAKSMSTGFDLLYPATVFASGIALWIYRRQLKAMDWRSSRRGIVVGTLVFVVWMSFDRLLNVRHDMPTALAHLSPSVRNAWIAYRAVAAIVTVPIVEELAFRGYLLRMFTAADFHAVRFRDVRWPALVASSALFGLMHGPMWLPGILAGLAYGWLAIRGDRLGEALAAHATTNAFIVACVLVLGDWQLW